MSENENTLANEATGEDAVETVNEAVADEAAATTLAPESAEESVAAAPNEKSAATAQGRRQEKIGLVTSNKMTKTVIVRVERQVRHPKYKRYIRRRKKFMAHDELGVNVGDIVRIIETRPLSARKRWRVVEVVQKAS
ncbi:MAG: 30S ribosomal protein S17 [Acidobacteria bacterium]|nr:30S ribosomal protein S17 [Acidobacteriota bacterium]